MYQTKKTVLTSELKISEFILNNPYLLLFLEHFGIDLPIQDKSLETICAENNVSLELLVSFANLYNGVQDIQTVDLSFDDAKAIIRYLKSSHRFYSDEIYPEIQNTIKRMAEVNDSSEMALVKKFFNEYLNEVKTHLDYEDDIVFPYVLNLSDKIQNKNQGEKSKGYSILNFREEHNDIEEKLDDLKQLLIKYLPHKNDRKLRRILLLSLFELEYDLNVHAQIEQLILIPLVEKMEAHLALKA